MEKGYRCYRSMKKNKFMLTGEMIEKFYNEIQ
jgi:hypothetical protein